MSSPEPGRRGQYGYRRFGAGLYLVERALERFQGRRGCRGAQPNGTPGPGVKGLPGRNRAAELGRDPGEIEIAPQFSVTVGKASEEAEARYMRSGLVGHRRSLAYTGRDLSRQVEANLVGAPDLSSRRSPVSRRPEWTTAAL